MAVCQNLVPLVNPKIAGKWMFIPLKIVLIGIDPYPNESRICVLTICVTVHILIYFVGPLWVQMSAEFARDWWLQLPEGWPWSPQNQEVRPCWEGSGAGKSWCSNAFHLSLTLRQVDPRNVMKCPSTIWETHIAMENDPFIVNCPIKMVIFMMFHSYISVYHRVCLYLTWTNIDNIHKSQ